MSNQRSEGWSRREFLTKVALAGTVGYLGLERSSLAAEPPPETTRIRLLQSPGICAAPEYVVKDCYSTRVSTTSSTYESLASTRFR